MVEKSLGGNSHLSNGLYWVCPTQYDMKLDVQPSYNTPRVTFAYFFILHTCHYLMDLVQPERETSEILSFGHPTHPQDKNHDLLTVAYIVQQNYPLEFSSPSFEALTKIDIKISPSYFRALPEPIICCTILSGLLCLSNRNSGESNSRGSSQRIEL